MHDMWGYRLIYGTASCLLLSSVLMAGSAFRETQTPGGSPPLTLGALALLVASEPEKGIPLLGEGVSHPAPGVRAVTARMVGVGRHVDFVPQLSSALERETDRYVAAEQVRALLLLGTPEALAAVDVHLPTAGQPVLLAYASWLARGHAARLIEQLPQLVAQLGTEEAYRLAPVVMMATYQHPTQRQALLRRWLQVAPPPAWNEALSSINVPEDAADDQVMREALSSDDADVRRHTVWAVLRWIGYRQRVRDVLLDAAGSSVTVSGEPTWEAVGREMVDRHRQRNAPRIDRSAFLNASLAQSSLYAVMLGELQVLTDQERAVVDAVVPPPPSFIGRLPRPVVNFHSTLPALRTVDGVWPGFLQSLLLEAGCEASADTSMGTLRLTYDASGRPTDSRLDRLSLSSACARALSAMALVEMADVSAPVRARNTQTVVLVPSPTFVSCADGPRWPERRAVDAPEVARTLRKTRDAFPRFPRPSPAGSGIVHMMATIEGNGCVRGARVVRGAAMPFDLEALRTVVHWQYEPPMVGSVPTPIEMQMTISFQ